MPPNSNLPEGTYGVQCEFNLGGQLYTYLVDPTQGEIDAGDYVVVATPKGGYKVISVIKRAEDLGPVKYMKYVVQRVSLLDYKILMAIFDEGLIDEDDSGEGVLANTEALLDTKNR